MPWNAPSVDIFTPEFLAVLLGPPLAVWFLRRRNVKRVEELKHSDEFWEPLPDPKSEQSVPHWAWLILCFILFAAFVSSGDPNRQARRLPHAPNSVALIGKRPISRLFVASVVAVTLTAGMLWTYDFLIDRRLRNHPGYKEYKERKHMVDKHENITLIGFLVVLVVFMISWRYRLEVPAYRAFSMLPGWLGKIAAWGFLAGLPFLFILTLIIKIRDPVLRRSRELAKNGDNAGAIKNLIDAIEKHKPTPIRLSELSVCLMKEKRNSEAYKYLCEAEQSAEMIQSNPMLKVIQLNKSTALINMEKFPEAIEILEPFTRHENLHWSFEFLAADNLCRAFLAVEKIDEAKVQLQRLESLLQKHPRMATTAPFREQIANTRELMESKLTKQHDQGLTA